MNAFRDDIVGFLPQLKNYARSLVRGDAYLADDLVQDTVANALRAESQFTPGTNLKAWLFTILRNRHLSSKNRRYLAAETSDDDMADHAWVPAAQEKAVETAEFRRAFRRLSPAHQRMLVLAVIRGMPYDKIAEMEGCEVGTVKSRINRARGMLRRLLGEDGSPARRTETHETGDNGLVLPKDAKLVISGMENLQSAVASAPVAGARQAAPGPEASGAFARVARVEVQPGAVLTSSSAFQLAASGEFAGAMTDKSKPNGSREFAQHYKR